MILNQILQPSSPSTSQSAVEALKSKLQSLNNSPKAKITIKSSKHRLSLSPKKAGHNDLSRLKVPAIPKDERSKSALQKSQAGMENFMNKKYIQEHPPSYPSIKVNSQPLVEIVNASDKIKLRGVSHIQKKIKESSDDIVNELRHLSFARCDSREDTSTLEEISSHIVKKGSSFDLTSFNKTYKVISNIKDKLQKREELISSMFMANNNKYTKDKYQDFDLKFAKTPIELREEILKGEGYNVNETDSVQEVWKKTKNAMKLIKDEEENEKRNLRRQEQYSRVNYSTDENMAVECLRVNNIVNDFVFDTAGFNRVLQESQVELDEKINKSMEKSMEQKAKKLNKLASCLGARKSQTSFISRPKTSNNNHSFELKKEQKKHKEEFEKQQKMELQAKMRDIDRKLETKQKRYQMMGIFSEEKNKTRIEAEKFVASFKEKSKFEANLFRFLQGAATNVPSPGKDSIVPTKSPSSKSLTSQNQSMYEQSQYERIKKIPENSVMNQLSDVLTRPVKDTLGEKIVRVGVYQKRLTDLRRKLNHTRIEKMSSDFTRLQFL